MNEKEVIKRPSKRKSIGIHIKVTKHASDWLKEKDYSPTGIFNEGMKDLGYKKPGVE